MYFTLLVPATCFGSFRSHLQAALYFLKKAMYTTVHVAGKNNVKHIF